MLYGDLPIPSCSGLRLALADASLGQAGSRGGQMEHIGSCQSDQNLCGSMWEDQEGLSRSLQQRNCLVRHSVGDGGIWVKTKLGACQVCVVWVRANWIFSQDESEPVSYNETSWCFRLLPASVPDLPCVSAALTAGPVARTSLWTGPNPQGEKAEVR